MPPRQHLHLSRFLPGTSSSTAREEADGFGEGGHGFCLLVAIDVHGLKKRGGGWCSWVRVDVATGQCSWVLVGASEVVEVAKRALMRRLDLPARDLGLLDPFFVYPSTTSAASAPSSATSSRYGASSPLMRRSSCATPMPTPERPRRRPRGGYIDELQRCLVDPADNLPFEFIALEVALEAACSFLDAELRCC